MLWHLEMDITTEWSLKRGNKYQVQEIHKWWQPLLARGKKDTIRWAVSKKMCGTKAEQGVNALQYQGTKCFTGTKCMVYRGLTNTIPYIALQVWIYDKRTKPIYKQFDMHMINIHMLPTLCFVMPTAGSWWALSWNSLINAIANHD